MVRASMVPFLAVCFGLVAQTPAPAPEAKKLSLQEAIQISLQNNLQVEIARQTRAVTYSGIMINEGTFDWNLAAGLQISRIETASQSPATPLTAPVHYEGVQWNRGGANGSLVSLSKNFVWGGSMSMSYDPNYSQQKNWDLVDGQKVKDSSFENPFPYSGSFSAKYSQNLLQGFGRAITEAPLTVARKNAQVADLTFQQSMINLVAQTEGYYWNLVYAQRFLDSARIALKEAEQQLRENKIRMEVGTMAPLDVTSAEAQVAQAEQNIITAEANLDNAKDTLVRALYPNAERPASLEATDSPTLAHTQVTEDQAVKMALDRRVELKTSRMNKDVAELQMKVAKDKTRPTLSAFASYTGNANTATTIGPVNSDLLSAKYPGYAVGISFAMPLQNRAAKGSLSAARAQFRSSELTLKDEELSIILEVRTAVRNVEATEKGVKAAEKTRYFQEKTLEAEQKKFENGMSTNFIVLQDMTNLDNARSAEVQAQINYANAVTALEKAVGNLMEARNLKVE